MVKGPSDVVQAAAINASVRIFIADRDSAKLQMGELAQKVATLAYAISVNFYACAKDGFDLPKKQD
jgi:hypothetical protein